MIYAKYEDKRITIVATADALAKAYSRCVLFKFEFSDYQTAYYVFGKRIAYTKRFPPKAKEGMPLHFDLTHFTAQTIGGRVFLYCPVGNICSWLQGDVEHKYCAWCKKGFEELAK